MKKFLAWMKSTGGIASYVALPIMAAVLILFYGSVIFNWNNIISRKTHDASTWWHVAGGILTGVVVYEIYSWSKRDTDRGDYILTLVILALSWCCFYGFNF